ncbi:MAG: hypothetical protein JEY99_10525 [Spirochaetales bacterium]|nr:hypothetical protein [Spirochaetales bacterium]
MVSVSEIETLSTNGANVFLKIPTISSQVLETVEGYAESEGSRTLTSRALLINNKSTVKLYSSDGTLLETWNIELSASSRASMGIETEYNAGFLVPVGTGYSMSVDIFNLAVSDTEPVVTGTSSSFDVVAGTSLSLEIACIPAEPSPLEESVDSPVIDLLPSHIDTSDRSATQWGSERWFSIVPTSNLTVVELIQAETLEISQFIGIYDEEGHLIDTISNIGLIKMSAKALSATKIIPISVQSYYGSSATFITTPGKTYYIGAVDIEYYNGTEPISQTGDFMLRYFPAEPIDNNNSLAEAVSITVNDTPIRSEISSYLDYDYYTFETTADVDYTIPIYGEDESVYYTLYDSNGDIVEEEESYYPIEFTGIGGTYVFRLSSYDYSSTAYTFQILSPYPDGNTKLSEAETLTADNEILARSMSNAGDYDYYTLTTTLDTEYSVIVDCGTGNETVYCNVYDSSESSIKWSTSYKFITFTAADTSHTISVKHNGWDTDYTIRVITTQEDSNTLPGEAVELGVDLSPVSDSLINNSDYDFFRFTPVSGDIYSITVEPADDEAVIIRACNSGGIETETLQYGTFPTIFVEGGDNDMYLKVYRLSGDPVDYNISVNTAFDDDNLVQNPGQAITLSDGIGSVLSNIGDFSDADFFQINTTKDSSYTVDISTTEGDEVRYMIGEGSSSIITSPVQRSGTPYTFIAETGIYKIAVYYGDAVTDYTVSVTEN